MVSWLVARSLWFVVRGSCEGREPGDGVGGARARPGDQGPGVILCTLYVVVFSAGGPFGFVQERGVGVIRWIGWMWMHTWMQTVRELG